MIEDILLAIIRTFIWLFGSACLAGIIASGFWHTFLWAIDQYDVLKLKMTEQWKEATAKGE